MKQQLLQILYSFLALCARNYLIRTKPFVIGITGSVGKTCCRDIVMQVLSQAQSEKIVYTSPKNYNSELGLIFSIFEIESYEPSFKNLLTVSLKILRKSIISKKSYDILVAEYGIDSPSDMDFLLGVMKPDIAVITKLDYVHSDNFPGGVEQYWGDKFKLLLSAKNKCYFNSQDNFIASHKELLSKPYEEIFSQAPEIQLQKTGSGLSQKFNHAGRKISINLLGEENVEYTLLGLKIARDMKIEFSEKKYDFEYILQPGRFSIFERNNNIFIDSTYNAGPESMKKVIENTKMIGRELYPDYCIIFVIGDMREIGEVKSSAHEKLAHDILDSTAVFTVGPDTYQFTIPALKKSGYQGETHSSLSSREIGKRLKKYLKDSNADNYVILFKGSQNTIFTEEALKAQLIASQQKNLPRQSEDWKRKKDEFFKNL